MTDRDKSSSAGTEHIPALAHISHCATNNAPALPVGPCDCGAAEVSSIASLVYPDWMHLDDKEPTDLDTLRDVVNTARRIYEAGYRKQAGAWDALESHGFPPEACSDLPQAIDNAITCLVEARESLLAELKGLRAVAQQPTNRQIHDAIADAMHRDGLTYSGIQYAVQAIQDLYEGARCSGSTSVSKTEGDGSIPSASATAQCSAGNEDTAKGFDPNKQYTNHLSVLIDAVGYKNMQKVKTALSIAGYVISKGTRDEPQEARK